MFIYDLDLPEIVNILISWGEPSYRAMQIWQGLYQNLYSSASQFSNLPKSLREKMNLELGFSEIQPVRFLDSGDGQTRKTLFKLHDDHLVETVLMRYDKRRTLCISTQVGCAMGCVFCATGQMGFKRNLSCGEIVAQVMYCARELHSEGQSITNIVVMGMGEPFHNYDNTMAAVDRLNNAQGFNFGARRFTISTVGLVPMIKRFSSEKRQVNLAISLHAADDNLRISMLPVNKRYGIDELLEACHEYVENTGRRITFEWALINGVNDTPEQARKLGLRLKGLLCHVIAIPLNPTKGYAGASTTRERALKFKEILENAGIPCTIRIHRGIDIEAGCGQLAERFS
jgi:23S rRNA (adenine2503-C2)-methyltransferase